MNEQIKSRATVAFLRKIGYAKTLPRAIAYGPKSRSGLGIKNMGIEQGLKKVLCYLQHQRRGCRVGQMFRIYVESYQLISGLSQSVLEDTRPLHYIEYWWIGCMHQFCIAFWDKPRKIKVWTIPKLREHDVHLMDAVLHASIKHEFSWDDITRFQRCRVFLQSTTLAEIVTSNGKEIHPEVWDYNNSDPDGKPWLWLTTRSSLQLPKQGRPGRKTFHDITWEVDCYILKRR